MAQLGNLFLLIVPEFPLGGSNHTVKLEPALGESSVISDRSRAAVIAPCAISSDKGLEVHIVPPSRLGASMRGPASTMHLVG